MRGRLKNRRPIFWPKEEGLVVEMEEEEEEEEEEMEVVGGIVWRHSRWRPKNDEFRVGSIASGIPGATELTIVVLTISRAPVITRWTIKLNIELNRDDEYRVVSIAPGFPDETRTTASTWTYSRAPGWPRWAIILNKGLLSRADTFTQFVQLLLNFGGTEPHNWSKAEWSRITRPSHPRP